MNLLLLLALLTGPHGQAQEQSQAEICQELVEEANESGVDKSGDAFDECFGIAYLDGEA